MICVGNLHGFDSPLENICVQSALPGDWKFDPLGAIESRLGGQMQVDLISLSQLVANALVNAGGELGVVSCERVLLILHAHKHCVDIFPHIL